MSFIQTFFSLRLAIFKTFIPELLQSVRAVTYDIEKVKPSGQTSPSGPILKKLKVPNCHLFQNFGATEYFCRN